jgi:pyridoxal 5'-phosphate synthase pdxS subunit
MAKARIGHFVEAQILQALKIDYIDESEVLTPADEECHIDKTRFEIPFVCGARNLGEALRRIAEGAAMIRTKGEAGTGNVVEAVRHMRTMNREIRQLVGMPVEEIMAFAKANGMPYQLALEVRNWAGCRWSISPPAALPPRRRRIDDAIGLRRRVRRLRHFQIQRSGAPLARAIVKATAYFNDPEKLLEVSMDLGEPMPGWMWPTCRRRTAGGTRLVMPRPPAGPGRRARFAGWGAGAPRSPAAARGAPHGRSSAPLNWTGGADHSRRRKHLPVAAC